jgi:hypothetical protein
MKMKYNFSSKMEKFLSNKTLLNIIVAISFLNIISFVMFGQTISIIYFILIGLVTSFFSKNMVVVLLIPLILVNLFVSTSNSSSGNIFNSREGLENNTDSSNDTNNSDKKNNKASTSVQNKVSSNKQSNSSDSKSTTQGLPITPLDHSSQTTNTNVQNDLSENENNTESKTDVDESFEVGRGKKNSKGYNIDYASTVEDAYDELNKILGSDGIKRLTSDTQGLMKQQLQLAESMKGMQPLIAGMAPLMQQAQGLLGSMGDTGNLGNLANIAKKFSATMGKQ